MVIGKLDNSIFSYYSNTSIYYPQRVLVPHRQKIDSKNLPNCILRNKMFSLVIWTSSTKVQRQGYGEVSSESFLGKNGFTSCIKFAQQLFWQKNMLLSSDIKIPLCVKLAYSLPFNLFFPVKKRNYLKMCICKNSCEDTLLQCYKMLLCYLYRIQADDIDCVILATTSVLCYKYLTRMVLTKEKETGSEDEIILLRSVNIPTIFS